MPRSSFAQFKGGDPVWYAPQGIGQKKEARFIRWTGDDRAEIQLLEDQLKGQNLTVSRSDLFSRDGTAPMAVPMAAPTPEELPPDDPARDPSNPLYKIVEVIDTVVKAIERTVVEAAKTVETANEAVETANEEKLDIAARAKTQLRRLAKARKALSPPLTPEKPKAPRKKHVWSPQQRAAASKRMTDMNARRREGEAAESPTPKLAQTE